MTLRWCGLIALSVGTLLTAQQQAPVFRAGVELVTMKVIVVDRQGNPVRGLTEADFAVRLEGQLRPVRVLNYLELVDTKETPIEARRESSNIGAAPVKPGGAMASRTFVLLVDDLSFRFTSSLLRVYRQALDKLLDEMRAIDRVAIVTTSGRIAPFGPTTDWAQVRARFDNLRGYFDIEDMRAEVFVSLNEAPDIRNVWTWEQASAQLQENAGRNTWKDVWDRECLIANHLCDMTLTPPPMYIAMRSGAINVLAFTEQQTSTQLRGLIDTLKSLAKARKPGELLTLVLFSEGLGSRAARQSDTLTRLSQTVAEAGVSFYVVTGHPDDVTPSESQGTRQRPRFEEQRELIDGLEDLAGATGATILRPVGLVGPSLTRILNETSGMYELAVEAPPNVAKRALSAQVTVNRKDVLVRMGRHAVSPSAPPPVVSTEQELTALITKGGGAYSVPMTVGTTLRRDDSRTGLQVGINLVIDEVAPPPFRVRFAIVDPEGRIVNSGRLVAPTRTASFAIEMPAGPHRLRLAAADATNAVGAIEHPVVGRLTPVDRFFASDLLVASVNPDGRAQLLVIGRVPPEAVSLSMRFELYAADVSADAGIDVRLDVGPAGAPPVVSTVYPMRIDNNALVLTAQVSLANVPPGAHLMTATVLDSGKEIGRVTSSFIKAK